MDKVILYISKIRLHYLAVEAKNMLLILMIALFGSVMITGAEASALGYQNNVGVSFTFEPVLAINLSSNALIIPNLTPGSSAYSNTITINVATNNIAGYTLSAKVGDGNTYTNDKLTNASSSTVFDNLSSSSNLTLSQFNDNVWGYALGTIDSNTTYSGLVYNTDTVINATTNNTGTAASSGCVSTCSGTNNTDFTIAAKAAATQASGDYSNVIIFTVVGNVPPKTINDLDYMQDFKSLTASDKTSVLASMTEGQSYNLTDKRDNKTYAVAKLKDGRVWMRENLALDITALTQAQLYGTGSDAGKMTNASNETLGYLKGASSRDATNEPNGNYPTAGVSKAWTSNAQNYSSVPMIAVDSTTSGPCNNADCVNDPTSGQWSYDSETTETINGTTSIAQGKIGVYYNYCAASAGSYCYGDGTASTGSPTSDPDTSTLLDVTEDICPAGWRLPTGGSSSGEFQALYTAYSSDANNFQTALSTPLSGYFYSGMAYGQGYYGFFWSSTWFITGMRFYVGASHVSPPPFDDTHFNGFSVRCILGS